MTHKFYDDARMMFGQTYPAGTTVSFQVGSSDTAVPYTLDVADFYNVPAATTQPANTVSVTSYGADPTGVSDSTSAFNQAITAANDGRGGGLDPDRHLPRQLAAADPEGDDRGRGRLVLADQDQRADRQHLGRRGPDQPQRLRDPRQHRRPA